MVFDAKMFVSKTVSFFPHSHRSYWFDKHQLESNRSQSYWIHKYGLRPKLLSVKCCKRPWNWFTVNLCCICLFLCFQSSSAGDCPAWSWFPVCTVGALGHCRTKVMSSCVDTINGQCVKTCNCISQTTLFIQGWEVVQVCCAHKSRHRRHRPEKNIDHNIDPIK